jgi:hypothetical protein
MTDGTRAPGEGAVPGDPVPGRIWYCVAQCFSVSMLLGLSWIVPKFEAIFKQLEMKHLPAPTELLLATAGVIRTPLGSITVVMAGVTLIALVFKGVFDPRLKRMFLFNVAGALALIPFAYLSLYMPILRIQRELQGR